MLQFPLASDAIVERLLVLAVAIPVVLRKAPPLLRQGDRVFAIAGHAHGLDEPLFAEMPQVAQARIAGPIVVIPEITSENHPKHTNGRQGAGFRAALGVLAVTIADDLPLQAARQVEMARERVTWVYGALALVAIAFRPACIIAAIAFVAVRM